ncbi:TPA: IS1 family transposase [Vibrio vulnificus]|uniref:transposase-like zinc-binding domain-containing protein n=1 Tax=Vibrio vulnificus TaxID=672 RepID=UPI0009328947|nr:hypothetical protein FORC17_1020 [Vibrio vulnificus]ELK2255096.1 IS1 family transposase [Vibrio vulnificus]MBN8144264.1 IS1 family transposase [Vibrio vulnificus]HDY7451190.1 IS1 family transposase [Vibrio vulnificus]HDY7491841.1 IS1 family transposase [Vibrio vulnificus]
MLEKILQAILSLSYTDTKHLSNTVKKKLDSDVVGKVIADREQCVSECPHCNSVEFYNHGVTTKRIQRYRCKVCKKTFCSLTKSALCRMRKEEKWLKYVSMMSEGVALRKIDKTLNISLIAALF